MSPPKIPYRGFTSRFGVLVGLGGRPAARRPRPGRAARSLLAPHVVRPVGGASPAAWAAAPPLDARAQDERHAAFWHRMLFGRWAIGVGLAIALALTPSFGPNRFAVAAVMASSTTTISAVLLWAIRRR